MNHLVPIHRALFSVTDKSGLAEFAAALSKHCPKINIIASGGTAQHLQKSNIPFTELSNYTSFPECFSGRVKTLHPKIAGGILMRRGLDDQEAKQNGISPIDLVVCNLYDFEGISKRKDVSLEELIESMDIGGSTLIRCGIKNHSHVAVVVDPGDYPSLIKELERHNGALTLETRIRLAAKAINRSADYEALLAETLCDRFGMEKTHRPALIGGKTLRYGENPDQSAWVYQFPKEVGIASAQVLGGKELSYNNFDDATAAYNAADELRFFKKPGCAVIKHGGLCGFATGDTLVDAFDRAWEGDPKSAFGSVIAFTHPLDQNMIAPLSQKFIEVIIAPDYEESFVNWAKEAKPKLRLIKSPHKKEANLYYKKISGGMLVQTQKKRIIPENIGALSTTTSLATPPIGVVTKKRPEPGKENLFAFAIATLQFVKSNAVTLVREYKPGCFQLIGTGGGQPNRVDSLQRLAIPKAQENLGRADLSDCILASDGFFPFDDSIRYAASYGIKTCIQPGGSVKDQDVIDAADELGVSMIFTGERYFTH